MPALAAPAPLPSRLAPIASASSSRPRAGGWAIGFGIGDSVALIGISDDSVIAVAFTLVARTTRPASSGGDIHGGYLQRLVEGFYLSKYKYVFD